MISSRSFLATLLVRCQTQRKQIESKEEKKEKKSERINKIKKTPRIWKNDKAKLMPHCLLSAKLKKKQIGPK